jgi:hypothetical protein
MIRGDDRFDHDSNSPRRPRLARRRPRVCNNPVERRVEARYIDDDRCSLVSDRNRFRPGCTERSGRVNAKTRDRHLDCRFRGSERELLAAFWQKVERYGRLVSFHGRGYDGPILMIRSAMLGVAPTRNLAGKPWDFGSHCDLMDVLSFQGAWRERYSLEYWCRRFGIESPKVLLDGSQVDRTYKEGKIELIADYCLRDCRATGELYQKLASTLIPLFG